MFWLIPTAIVAALASDKVSDTATTKSKKRPVGPRKRAAGVLYWLPSERKMLVLRRSQTDPSWPGYWDLPGGTLEQGEAPVDGAYREAEEEAGPVPEHAQLGVMEFSDPGDNHDYTLVVVAVTKPFTPTLSDEHDAWDWVTGWRAYNLLMMPSIRKSLGTVYRQRNELMAKADAMLSEISDKT